MKIQIFAIITAYACSLSICHATDWTSTNGLAVRISSSCTGLHPGDALHVNVEIQNTSTNPITIHRIPNPWEWLIVEDEAGKEFPSYPNAILSLLPASPDDFVVLAPSEIHSGVLSATLVASHSYSNAHWNPQYMKLVSGTMDYDLPPGPFSIHYKRGELAEEHLKTNGEWRSFRDIFPAKQWVGEIRSLDLKIEAKKDSQQSVPEYPPQGVGSSEP